MTFNNKNGLFRPWDEDNEDKDISRDIEDRGHGNFKYLSAVDVKCERTDEEDQSASGPGSSPSSPDESATGSNSSCSNLILDQEEEEDTLHKLTSLVDRTILGLPKADNSVDSSSSSSEASSSSPSPVDDDNLSQRSAFVPARLNHQSAFTFAGVSYPPVSQRFEPSGGSFVHQDILARQEHHVAFDHYAAQQGHFALEEAARLLQHHEALVKQNKKLRPKKFRCPHCDVAFSNNGQLKGHIRIHTGERPFKCDEEACGKTFTRNEELTRHKRIHSGVRPHACPACGKRFGRKDHLKKHARTHEMRGPAIYIPAPGPFPFPAHPPLHPFLFGL